MIVFVIHPYKINKNIDEPWNFDDLWFFDDPILNIKNEQFLSGSELFMKQINKSFSDNNKSFILMFSDEPFDDAKFILEWKNDIYYFKDFNLFGHLPDKLLNYFKYKPNKIYLSAIRKEDL